MSSKTTLSSEDQQLFAEAVKNVTPIQSNAKNMKASPVDKLPNKRIRYQIDHPLPPKTAFVHLDNLAEADWKEIDDILSFNRAGLQDKLLKKLSKGQLPIEARADLHGMTVIKALTFLDGFIKDCERWNKRHLLIIHGKGLQTHKPVLKNAINIWLKDQTSVLAFRSALPKDGGTGAVYVLIRATP